MYVAFFEHAAAVCQVPVREPTPWFRLPVVHGYQKGSHHEARAQAR